MQRTNLRSKYKQLFRQLEKYKKNEKILVNELINHKTIQEDICKSFRIREKKLINQINGLQESNDRISELEVDLVNKIEFE